MKSNPIIVLRGFIVYARKNSMYFIDTSQARIKSMKDRERMRSRSFMLNKPSGLKGRWATF
jgi:hypothetical protein